MSRAEQFAGAEQGGPAMIRGRQRYRPSVREGVSLRPQEAHRTTPPSSAPREPRVGADSSSTCARFQDNSSTRGSWAFALRMSLPWKATPLYAGFSMILAAAERVQ